RLRSVGARPQHDPARARRRTHLDGPDLAGARRARLSIGFSFMPAMTAAFAAMRPDQLSDATPQLNVVMRLGGTIGTAVLAVVLERAGASAQVHNPVKLAHAFDTAYWWALGIAVMSLVPSFMLLHAERPQ